MKPLVTFKNKKEFKCFNCGGTIVRKISETNNVSIDSEGHPSEFDTLYDEYYICSSCGDDLTEFVRRVNNHFYLSTRGYDILVSDLIEKRIADNNINPFGHYGKDEENE